MEALCHCWGHHIFWYMFDYYSEMAIHWWTSQRQRNGMKRFGINRSGPQNIDSTYTHVLSHLGPYQTAWKATPKRRRESPVVAMGYSAGGKGGILG